MRSCTCWLAMVVVLVSVGLAGCGSPGRGEERAKPPAVVDTEDGSDVGRVVLTEQAAKRIGLKTEAVQSLPSAGIGGSFRMVVPLAAVLYDKDGVSWVYTSPKPLTFIRQRIVVGHVRGDRALLRSGPPAGTLVVTVGGAELLGTEYVVSGE
jgi:hypothetical protein